MSVNACGGGLARKASQPEKGPCAEPQRGSREATAKFSHQVSPPSGSLPGPPKRGAHSPELLLLVYAHFFQAKSYPRGSPVKLLHLPTRTFCRRHKRFKTSLGPRQALPGPNAHWLQLATLLPSSSPTRVRPNLRNLPLASEHCHS